MRDARSRRATEGEAFLRANQLGRALEQSGARSEARPDLAEARRLMAAAGAGSGDR